MDKILICGPRGVGKSTLIRRLTALYPGPVSGFVTKRETVADDEGLFPIYIHTVDCTGRPISSASTRPPRRGMRTAPSRWAITEGERPVV